MSHKAPESTTPDPLEPGDSPAHHSRFHPDSWQWRHRVRENPRTKGPYRLAVATVGGFFIILAGLTGWLPGPGGIPLALLGLAVLASEFHWAKRILDRCTEAYHRFVDWAGSFPAYVRFLGTVAVVAAVLTMFWAYLALTSVPSFMPSPATILLDRLPYVER